MKKLINRTHIAAVLVAVMMFALGISAFATYETPTFTDVPKSHWAYTYVEQAVERGWISGMGDGTFQPEGNVTYAQMATMLTQTFFPEEVNAYTGSDQPWYQKYCDVANNAGLFTKTMVSSLSYNDSMSRYDMAQMVYNSITAKGYQVTVDVGAIWTSTADWIFIPYQYRDAVAVTKTCGIINGMDEKGTFGGGLNMTRAQASVVLFGLYDGLANADSDPKMTYVGASKPNPDPGTGTGPDTGAGTGTGNTNPPGNGKGYTPASGVKASVGKNDQYPTKGSAAVPNKNGYYTAADIDFGDAKLVYELLDMVNQARAAEGHAPLKWVPMDAMEEYTLLRAYELESKWSHERPNGLYNEFMIENIAGTCKDSRVVFDAWMNSPGHRRTIMDDNWTFMCAAKGGGSGADPWIITFGTDFCGQLCEGGTYVNYTKQNGWQAEIYWD